MAVKTRRFPAVAIAIGALATLGVWGPATARAAREQTATYAGTSDPVVAATAGWATGLNTDVACVPGDGTPAVAGACFAVLPGDAAVRVRIQDAVAPLARGSLRFVDAAGNDLGDTVDFCRRVEAAIPDGAAGVVVRVLPDACAPASAPVPAAGTIVAYFTG